MDELFGLSTGQDRFNTLLEKARSVHGELVDKFVAVLEEQDRQFDIINRRGTITGEEHRFFLALLLNVPSREKILELIKRRFPESDPVEKILDWVEELGQTRVLGSKEPNALGIDGFNDEHITVLQDQLSGRSDEEIRKLVKPDRHEALVKDLQNSTLFQNLELTPIRGVL